MPLCTFRNYIATAGYRTADIWNAHFRQSHSEPAEITSQEVSRRVAALLQAWLYYGLLESVVKKKIHVSYLMRPGDDGNEYLYSRNLHFSLQMRVFDIRANPAQKAQASMEIQQQIRLAHDWLSRITAWSHPSFRPKIDDEYPELMDQLEEIVPAAIRLVEAIEQMRLYVLPKEPTLGTLTWQYPYEVANRRRSKLNALGWCAFQIKLLEDTVNQSTIDWLIACNKKQDPTGHETCTAKACARNDIDESTYQQAHVCLSGRCQKILPDARKVMTTLIDDQIPVMRLQEQNGRLAVDVSGTPKTEPGNYIAISHVWADGLGGATETGLNECQARRLSDLCSALNQSTEIVWFWLDCLCIPRTDKDVYIRALISIRDVYLQASSVLVLDKTIMKCKMSSSTEDLYIHIYLSAWMQRMWTYEEAVLARKVIFALEDGFHPYKVDTKPSMRRTVSVVWQTLGAQLYRLRADREHLNIGHIYQAFRYRLTNAPQEEFLSIAGMLDLDTEMLLHVKGEDRTKRFWLQLKWVPFNVPFLECPKMSEPGFRWAPRTLMYPTSTTMDSAIDGQKSECTKDGLFGVYLTVCFDTRLRGSAGEHGSIFYTFIRGHDGSLGSQHDHRGSLRLYCVESWPKPPEGLEFNAIMFPSETKSVLSAGAWVAAVALLRTDSINQPQLDLGQPQLDQQPKKSENHTYRYVGRLLVERLQNHELSSSSKTIMFEGTSKASIDAQGCWGIQKVCIT
ncbi:MAG: hypothetical protein Q9168_003905 [Polycauliona sp. 1 TL-2023]